MTARNLTEVFVIMRNNASKNRNLYGDDRRGGGDAEHLLHHSLREAEEGLELRDDFGTPPPWIDKLEEAQYTLSKIKPKLDELGSLHARHLLRPAFDENTEEELEIEELSQEISKLITSTHRHIQCIRSSLGVGTKLEQRLTANVVTCLLLVLQELTNKYRNSQNIYIRQLNSREECSQKYFDNGVFTNIDLNGTNNERENYVDTFDNFLQPTTSSGAIATSGTLMKLQQQQQQQQQQQNEQHEQQQSTTSITAIPSTQFLYENETEEQIDEHFQRPVANRMTQQQLLLFEEENTKMAIHREEEVAKIVKSIYDLNDIFKDLGQMVQEQGTILDRIDYNVEQTQTRVTEGLRQLQRAEMYQRKNRKMCVILVLAAVTLFMLLLLIFTKF